MAIPLSYNYRNLIARKLTTLLTLLGITLVVFVFAAVLMLAYGLRKTLVSTGSPDNFVVIRKSANSDGLSQVSRDSARLVETFPEVATPVRRETPFFEGNGGPDQSHEIRKQRYGQCDRARRLSRSPADEAPGERSLQGGHLKPGNPKSWWANRFPTDLRVAGWEKP